MIYKDMPTYNLNWFRQATIVSEGGEVLLVSTIEVPEPSDNEGYLYDSAILIGVDESGYMVGEPEDNIIHRIRTNDEFVAKLYHIVNKYNAANLIRG